MKLLRMDLKNFMCYEEQRFDFCDCTCISGRNGQGKSSIASAYTWCLFDCDYNLKSNPVVRREVDGEPVMDSDVEVTLLLDLDGREVEIRKVQKRKYSKDGTYKDDNKYFINDVAKTKKDFEAYLEIDMKVLKACSNIDFFINQKPEDMRSYLFSLVEDVSDLDICKKNESLSGLIPMLEKYSVDELAAMNKRKLTEADKELPVLRGQIKEKENDIKTRSDFDLSALELQKNALKEQISENLKKQTDMQKLLDEYDFESNGILELKFKLSDMKNRANDELNNERRELNAQMADINGKINHMQTLVAMNRSSSGNIKLKIMSLNNEKNNEAGLWKLEKQREFDENSLVCPYCGRELEISEQERLKTDFLTKKEAKLKEIEENGMSLKKEIEENTEKLNEVEESTARLNEKINSLSAMRDTVAEKIKNLPAVADISETKDCKEIEQQIHEKEKSMEKFQSITDMKARLKQEENDLNEQIRSVDRRLDWADTQKEVERLEELKARRIELEQGKADAECVLALLDDLKRIKNVTLSDDINRSFGIVRWKLFDYAKNGSYKSVCVPMVDGKSILSTISNKGNRIIGKLDICQSIQKIEDVHAPIWLDDCESLDSDNKSRAINMVGGQLIMLAVNDSDLLVSGGENK